MVMLIGMFVMVVSVNDDIIMLVVVLCCVGGIMFDSMVMMIDLSMLLVMFVNVWVNSSML